MNKLPPLQPHADTSQRTCSTVVAHPATDACAAWLNDTGQQVLSLSACAAIQTRRASTDTSFRCVCVTDTRLSQGVVSVALANSYV